MTTPKLQALIESLKLRGIQACIDEVLQQAQVKQLAYDDVLIELFEAQYHFVQTRQLENRIKQAKLPWEWTLESFPFKKQPNINKIQIMQFAKLDFIPRGENIVFIGNPGTGKSGLAMGLLRLALINGYRGLFCQAQDLLNELYASLADRTTSRLLKKMSAYDILVIDELGYLTLNTEQVNIFFKLIDMRYHRKSTIITTNLEYSQWYDVFKQKDLVDALLDRFRHYCHTITIDGPSLRVPINPTVKKTKKTQPTP